MRKLTIIIGMLLLSAGICLAGASHLSGPLLIRDNDTTDTGSVAVSTGDIFVDGYIECDKDLDVGGTASVSGDFTIDDVFNFSTLVSTTATSPTAAYQVIMSTQYHIMISTGVSGNWYDVGGK